MKTLSGHVLGVLFFGIAAGACSGTDGTASSAGGSSGTNGGTTGTSTQNAGGAQNVGGSQNAGGVRNAGGSQDAGGAQNAGGSLSVGGAQNAGGSQNLGGTTPAGGKANGGTTTTGGSAASGGKSNGGTTTTGGSAASGGKSNGGTTTTGGSVAAGGKAAGGTIPAGGTVAAGGKATGGAATGGAATGGAATGGAATGGATATSCSFPSGWTPGSPTYTTYTLPNAQTACGYNGSNNTIKNIAVGANFAAIPGNTSSDFNTSNRCGACVQIGSAIVTIVDECPNDSNAPCKANPNGHLDLSNAAANAGGVKGDPALRNQAAWKFVPCPINGNVMVRLKNGNNNEFFVENEILPIASVVCGSQTASRTSYGAWHVANNVNGQSCTLTDVANRSITINIGSTQGQDVDSGKQFPKCN